jgi:hypothetical protein
MSGESNFIYRCECGYAFNFFTLRERDFNAQQHKAGKNYARLMRAKELRQ